MIVGQLLVASLAAIFLNELLPNPSGEGEEWVELYNAGSHEEVLNGFFLEDKAGRKEYIGDEAIISGQGFFVYARKEGWLNNNGSETLWLRDAQGGTIDEVQYDGWKSEFVDMSYGRSPDGGSWMMFSSPTKGGSNPTPTPPPTETPLFSPTPTPSPSMPPPLPSPSPTPTTVFSPPPTPIVLGVTTTPTPRLTPRPTPTRSPSPLPSLSPSPSPGSTPPARYPWTLLVLTPILLLGGIGCIGLALVKSGVIEWKS